VSPPAPGSLQEALCILVFRAREEYELLGLVLSLVKEDDIQHKNSLLEDYKSVRFPFLKKEEEKTQKTVEEVFEKVFSGGTYVIDSSKVNKKLGLVSKLKNKERRWRR
jgi:hypothetical protein